MNLCILIKRLRRSQVKKFVKDRVGYLSVDKILITKIKKVVDKKNDICFTTLHKRGRFKSHYGS